MILPFRTSPPSVGAWVAETRCSAGCLSPWSGACAVLKGRLGLLSILARLSLQAWRTRSLAGTPPSGWVVAPSGLTRGCSRASQLPPSLPCPAAVHSTVPGLAKLGPRRKAGERKLGGWVLSGGRARRNFALASCKAGDLALDCVLKDEHVHLSAFKFFRLLTGFSSLDWNNATYAYDRDAVGSAVT
jgi:hypothetical protein